MPEQNKNLKNGQFSVKFEKVVRVVLYGSAISQSDCRKAGPYQLPCNKVINLTKSEYSTYSFWDPSEK